MTDITHTKEGDIDLTHEDLAYGESTAQHQQDLLLAGKGHYKESPGSGVNILLFLHDTEPENLLRTIRKEFTKDGMKMQKISITNGQLNTDAIYENSNS